METLSYSDQPPRRHWLAWPALLTMISLIHFSLSVMTWVVFYALEFRNAAQWPRTLAGLIAATPQFAPAVALLVLSAIAYRRAVMQRRGPWVWLAVILLLSITLFWVDVTWQRYQVSIFATTEYWEQGGRAHYYFTWWWFNDRWLH